MRALEMCDECGHDLHGHTDRRCGQCGCLIDNPHDHEWYHDGHGGQMCAVDGCTWWRDAIGHVHPAVF